MTPEEQRVLTSKKLAKLAISAHRYYLSNLGALQISRSYEVQVAVQKKVGIGLRQMGRISRIELALVNSNGYDYQAYIDLMLTYMKSINHATL